MSETDESLSQGLPSPAWYYDLIEPYLFESGYYPGMTGEYTGLTISFLSEGTRKKGGATLDTGLIGVIYGIINHCMTTFSQILL